MDVKLIHVFRCPACLTKHEVELQWAVGNHVPMPMPPEGWTRVNNRFYCPSHVVTLVIDFRVVGRIEGEDIQMIDGPEPARALAAAVAQHTRSALAGRRLHLDDAPAS